LCPCRSIEDGLNKENERRTGDAVALEAKLEKEKKEMQESINLKSHEPFIGSLTLTILFLDSNGISLFY
jgi:hypothetical protein